MATPLEVNGGNVSFSFWGFKRDSPQTADNITDGCKPVEPVMTVVLWGPGVHLYFTTARWKVKVAIDMFFASTYHYEVNVDRTM